MIPKDHGRIPRRVVCLTEESVETLYLLGLQKHIVGISAFVRRPREARKKKIVTSFVKANTKLIAQLKPDLIVGYSDIQKDIARELIGEGFPVWIANHHSLEEILNYIVQLGSMFGKREEAISLVKTLEHQMSLARRSAKTLRRKPKVYFEEWDQPMISGIRWVSEAIELCGGRDIFSSLKMARLAKDRFVSVSQVKEKNPDIVLGCWCGKKFNESATTERLGTSVRAVQNGQFHELDPSVFLQPGPAIFLDGLGILCSIFHAWDKS